jgi:predicted phage-related endonuclease
MSEFHNINTPKDNNQEPIQYIDKKPQKYLGPSQFASVLGMSSFQTPDQLKERMENGYKQAIYSQMAFGNKYEQTALYCYRKNTGEKVIKASWSEHPANTKIGGIADGLLVIQNGNIVGGLEIKCHQNRTRAYQTVPDFYLVQIAGYMDIYQVKFWDFMSCSLDPNGNIIDFNIIRVHWDEIAERWDNEWYPKLKSFIDTIKWAKI